MLASVNEKDGGLDAGWTWDSVGVNVWAPQESSLQIHVTRTIDNSSSDNPIEPPTRGYNQLSLQLVSLILASPYRDSTQFRNQIQKTSCLGANSGSRSEDLGSEALWNEGLLAKPWAVKAALRSDLL